MGANFPGGEGPESTDPSAGSAIEQELAAAAAGGSVPEGSPVTDVKYSGFKNNRYSSKLAKEVLKETSDALAEVEEKRNALKDAISSATGRLTDEQKTSINEQNLPDPNSKVLNVPSDRFKSEVKSAATLCGDDDNAKRELKETIDGEISAIRDSASKNLVPFYEGREGSDKRLNDRKNSLTEEIKAIFADNGDDTDYYKDLIAASKETPPQRTDELEEYLLKTPDRVFVHVTDKATKNLIIEDIKTLTAEQQTNTRRDRIRLIFLQRELAQIMSAQRAREIAAALDQLDVAEEPQPAPKQVSSFIRAVRALDAPNKYGQTNESFDHIDTIAEATQDTLTQVYGPINKPRDRFLHDLLITEKQGALNKEDFLTSRTYRRNKPKFKEGITNAYLITEAKKGNLDRTGSTIEENLKRQEATVKALDTFYSAILLPSDPWRAETEEEMEAAEYLLSRESEIHKELDNIMGVHPDSIGDIDHFQQQDILPLLGGNKVGTTGYLKEFANLDPEVQQQLIDDIVRIAFLRNELSEIQIAHDARKMVAFESYNIQRANRKSAVKASENWRMRFSSKEREKDERSGVVHELLDAKSEGRFARFMGRRRIESYKTMGPLNPDSIEEITSAHLKRSEDIYQTSENLSSILTSKIKEDLETLNEDQQESIGRELASTTDKSQFEALQQHFKSGIAEAYYLSQPDGKKALEDIQSMIESNLTEIQNGSILLNEYYLGQETEGADLSIEGAVNQRADTLIAQITSIYSQFTPESPRESSNLDIQEQVFISPDGLFRLGTGAEITSDEFLAEFEKLSPRARREMRDAHIVLEFARLELAEILHAKDLKAIRGIVDNYKLEDQGETEQPERLGSLQPTIEIKALLNVDQYSKETHRIFSALEPVSVQIVDKFGAIFDTFDEDKRKDFSENTNGLQDPDKLYAPFEVDKQRLQFIEKLCGGYANRTSKFDEKFGRSIEKFEKDIYILIDYSQNTLYPKNERISNDQSVEKMRGDYVSAIEEIAKKYEAQSYDAQSEELQAAFSDTSNLEALLQLDPLLVLGRSRRSDKTRHFDTLTEEEKVEFILDYYTVVSSQQMLSNISLTTVSRQFLQAAEEVRGMPGEKTDKETEGTPFEAAQYQGDINKLFGPLGKARTKIYDNMREIIDTFNDSQKKEFEEIFASLPNPKYINSPIIESSDRIIFIGDLCGNDERRKWEFDQQFTGTMQDFGQDINALLVHSKNTLSPENEHEENDKVVDRLLNHYINEIIIIAEKNDARSEELQAAVSDTSNLEALLQLDPLVVLNVLGDFDKAKDFDSLGDEEKVEFINDYLKVLTSQQLLSNIASTVAFRYYLHTAQAVMAIRSEEPNEALTTQTATTTTQKTKPPSESEETTQADKSVETPAHQQETVHNKYLQFYHRDRDAIRDDRDGASHNRNTMKRINKLGEVSHAIRIELESGKSTNPIEQKYDLLELDLRNTLLSLSLRGDKSINSSIKTILYDTADNKQRLLEVFEETEVDGELSNQLQELREKQEKIFEEIKAELAKEPRNPKPSDSLMKSLESISEDTKTLEDETNRLQLEGSQSVAETIQNVLSSFSEQNIDTVTQQLAQFENTLETEVKRNRAILVLNAHDEIQKEEKVKQSEKKKPAPTSPDPEVSDETANGKTTSLKQHVEEQKTDLPTSGSKTQSADIPEKPTTQSAESPGLSVRDSDPEPAKGDPEVWLGDPTQDTEADEVKEVLSSGHAAVLEALEAAEAAHEGVRIPTVEEVIAKALGQEGETPYNLLFTLPQLEQLAHQMSEANQAEANRIRELIRSLGADKVDIKAKLEEITKQLEVISSNTEKLPKASELAQRILENLEKLSDPDLQAGFAVAFMAGDATKVVRGPNGDITVLVTNNITTSPTVTQTVGSTPVDQTPPPAETEETEETDTSAGSSGTGTATGTARVGDPIKVEISLAGLQGLTVPVRAEGLPQNVDAQALYALLASGVLSGVQNNSLANGTSTSLSPEIQAVIDAMRADTKELKEDNKALSKKFADLIDPQNPDGFFMMMNAANERVMSDFRELLEEQAADNKAELDAKQEQIDALLTEIRESREESRQQAEDFRQWQRVMMAANRHSNEINAARLERATRGSIDRDTSLPETEEATEAKIAETEARIEELRNETGEFINYEYAIGLLGAPEALLTQLRSEGQITASSSKEEILTALNSFANQPLNRRLAANDTEQEKLEEWYKVAVAKLLIDYVNSNNDDEFNGVDLLAYVRSDDFQPFSTRSMQAIIGHMQPRDNDVQRGLHARMIAIQNIAREAELKIGRNPTYDLFMQEITHMKDMEALNHQDKLEEIAALEAYLVQLNEHLATFEEEEEVENEFNGAILEQNTGGLAEKLKGTEVEKAPRWKRFAKKAAKLAVTIGGSQLVRYGLTAALAGTTIATGGLAGVGAAFLVGGMGGGVARALGRGLERKVFQKEKYKPFADANDNEKAKLAKRYKMDIHFKNIMDLNAKLAELDVDVNGAYTMDSLSEIGVTQEEVAAAIASLTTAKELLNYLELPKVTKWLEIELPEGKTLEQIVQRSIMQVDAIDRSNPTIDFQQFAVPTDEFVNKPYRNQVMWETTKDFAKGFVIGGIFGAAGRMVSNYVAGTGVWGTQKPGTGGTHWGDWNGGDQPAVTDDAAGPITRVADTPSEIDEATGPITRVADTPSEVATGTETIEMTELIDKQQELLLEGGVNDDLVNEAYGNTGGQLLSSDQIQDLVEKSALVETGAVEQFTGETFEIPDAWTKAIDMDPSKGGNWESWKLSLNGVTPEGSWYDLQNDVIGNITEVIPKDVWMNDGRVGLIAYDALHEGLAGEVVNEELIRALTLEHGIELTEHGTELTSSLIDQAIDMSTALEDAGVEAAADAGGIIRVDTVTGVITNPGDLVTSVENTGDGLIAYVPSPPLSDAHYQAITGIARNTAEHVDTAIAENNVLTVVADESRGILERGATAAGDFIKGMDSQPLNTALAGGIIAGAAVIPAAKIGASKSASTMGAPTNAAGDEITDQDPNARLEAEPLKPLGRAEAATRYRALNGKYSIHFKQGETRDRKDDEQLKRIQSRIMLTEYARWKKDGPYVANDLDNAGKSNLADFERALKFGPKANPGANAPTDDSGEYSSSELEALAKGLNAANPALGIQINRIYEGDKARNAKHLRDDIIRALNGNPPFNRVSSPISLGGVTYDIDDLNAALRTGRKPDNGDEFTEEELTELAGIYSVDDPGQLFQNDPASLRTAIVEAIIAREGG